MRNLHTLPLRKICSQPFHKLSAVKKPVQIRPEHAAADRAVSPAVLQTAKGRRAVCLRLPHVDLITRERRAREGIAGADSVSARPGLLPREHGVDRQKPKPGQLALLLRAEGIGKRPAQHLISAADSENRRPAPRRVNDRVGKAAVIQPAKISHRVLRTGQKDAVGIAELINPADIANAEAWVLLRRGEIRKVGDVRQTDDGKLQRPLCLYTIQLRGKAVLVVNVCFQIRNDAEHRNLRQSFQLMQTGAQQFRVAAELVDDRPHHAPPFLRAQQGDGTVQLGEDAAAVDVADQQHRRVDKLRKPHVHNVILAQVDLGGGARALNHENIVFGGETVIGAQNIGDQAALHFEVFLRVVMPAHLAVHNELASRVAGGFQQNGIHAHVALDPGGLGLHRLGASEFQSVWRDIAVEGHVLALEGRGAVSVLREDPAQGGDQQAFARAGHGALNHDAFSHAAPPKARSAARCFPPPCGLPCGTSPRTDRRNSRSRGSESPARAACPPAPCRVSETAESLLRRGSPADRA